MLKNAVVWILKVWSCKLTISRDKIECNKIIIKIVGNLKQGFHKVICQIYWIPGAVFFNVIKWNKNVNHIYKQLPVRSKIDFKLNRKDLIIIRNKISFQNYWKTQVRYFIFGRKGKINQNSAGNCSKYSRASIRYVFYFLSPANLYFNIFFESYIPPWNVIFVKRLELECFTMFREQCFHDNEHHQT